jgi:hypothetical protein
MCLLGIKRQPSTDLFGFKSGPQQHLGESNAIQLGASIWQQQQQQQQRQQVEPTAIFMTVLQQQLTQTGG